MPHPTLIGQTDTKTSGQLSQLINPAPPMRRPLLLDLDAMRCHCGPQQCSMAMRRQGCFGTRLATVAVGMVRSRQNCACTGAGAITLIAYPDDPKIQGYGLRLHSDGLSTGTAGIIDTITMLLWFPWFFFLVPPPKQNIRPKQVLEV